MAYKPKSHVNRIEWVDNDAKVHCKITQKKLQNRIKKMHETYPEDVEIVGTHPDGTFECFVPYSALRFTIWKKTEADILSNITGVPSPGFENEE